MESIASFRGCIYFIHNTVTDGVYVGQTIMEPKKRWFYHRNKLRNKRHHNRWLQHSWDKHGESSFEFIVIEVHQSQEAVDRAEMFFIEYFRVIGVSLYNLTSGGDVCRHSPETIEKMRQAKRPPHTAEQRAKMSAWMRENQSSIATPERNEKIRQSKLGKARPAEARQNMRLAAERRIARTYQFKGPDGIVYQTNNIRAFARDHNLDNANLYALVHGKMPRYRGWIVYHDASDDAQWEFAQTRIRALWD